MPKKRNYKTRRYSVSRTILADYNDVAASFNRVVGLIEIDITEGLEKIAEIEKKENYKVSLTSWIAKCGAEVIKENKILNSYRRFRKFIIFDEIDISIIIEITSKSGKKIPYNYVIRNVDKKSVRTITDEIRAFQNKKIDEQEQLTRGTSKFTSLYLLLPKFFRRFVIRRMLVNPFRLKKLIGTVGITSLGMFIPGQAGYAIPFADKTLNVALGGIKDHLKLKDGKVEERKLLCTTFLMDHNIVDGAPAARFISQFSKELSETTYLDELDKI